MARDGTPSGGRPKGSVNKKTSFRHAMRKLGLSPEESILHLNQLYKNPEATISEKIQIKKIFVEYSYTKPKEVEQTLTLSEETIKAMHACTIFKKV